MSSIVTKFSTLLGGLFIEQIAGSTEYTGAERCFRFDEQGRASYAVLKDVQDSGERARFFGHVYTEKDFTFA